MKRLRKEPFGTAPDGRAVDLYHLDDGIEVDIATYGAIVVACRVPDRDGRLGHVVLGHGNLAGYLNDTAYLGATVGRYANRIAGGRFTLDGQAFQLPLNNGPNSLHGADAGFSRALWNATIDDGIVHLRHTSAAGEGGYPGQVHCAVRFAVIGTTLHIEYEATADQPTVLNLTNHAYFNLRDGGRTSIVDHNLTLGADRYTPVDENLIPTGEIASVEGTPFDFRAPTAIGQRIDAAHPQLQRAGGYDHNFVISGRTAARVREPETGRVLEVTTTQPGLQLYTGNFLDGSIEGRDGIRYQRRSGFCIETQHFPDSPNQPSFPSSVLRPGEVYRHRVEYRFSVE